MTNHIQKLIRALKRRGAVKIEAPKTFKEVPNHYVLLCRHITSKFDAEGFSIITNERERKVAIRNYRGADLVEWYRIRKTKLWGRKGFFRTKRQRRH